MSGDVFPHPCPSSASFLSFCFHLNNGLTVKNKTKKQKAILECSKIGVGNAVFHLSAYKTYLNEGVNIIRLQINKIQSIICFDF